MGTVDYSGLSEYAKAWPDKLVEYFRFTVADDEAQEFVKGFWDYCQTADKDGPAIKGWLES